SSAVKSWPGLCSGGWRSRTSRVMTMASTASLNASARPVSDRCPDRSSDWLIGALFPTRLDQDRAPTGDPATPVVPAVEPRLVEGHPGMLAQASDRRCLT